MNMTKEERRELKQLHARSKSLQREISKRASSVLKAESASTKQRDAVISRATKEHRERMKLLSKERKSIDRSCDRELKGISDRIAVLEGRLAS